MNQKTDSDNKKATQWEDDIIAILKLLHSK